MNERPGESPSDAPTPEESAAPAPSADPIAALIAKKLKTRIAEREAANSSPAQEAAPAQDDAAPAQEDAAPAQDAEPVQETAPAPSAEPAQDAAPAPDAPPAQAPPPAPATPPALTANMTRGQRRMARARAKAARPRPAPSPRPSNPKPAAPRQPSSRDDAQLTQHRRYRSWNTNAKDAVQRSPAFAIAGFLHLLLLVGLSFWTIASHLQKEVLPVEVRIAKPQKVVPITAGTDQSQDAALDALQDATKRDLQALSEADTDDPFHEARGDASGEVNVFGVGGGGRAGVGRGGKRNNRGGASKASDGALTGGLEWLARHQSTEGAWTQLKESHPNPDRRRPKGGDLARTGLAVLCFLCGDHAPNKPGPYQRVVKRGVEWLIKRTDRLGRLAKGLTSGRRRWHYNYEHAIATLAMSEALSRWKDPDLRAATERAVSYILADQTQYGWRYGFGTQDTDTSVTSWMVLALRSAEHAGVEIPSASYNKVRLWLAMVSGKDGTTAYVKDGRRTPAMNASGLFLRIMLGESPATTMNKRATGLVSQSQIQIEGGGIENLYHIYYAALAMYQVGGKPWKTFNPRIRDGLVGTQHHGEGCKRGSWKGGGYITDRVLATCFATLTLETYYRYLPVHKGPELEEEVETLSEGERLLDVAGASMEHARTSKALGEVLAARVAYQRALRVLQKDQAPWSQREVAHLALVELGQLGTDPETALAATEAYLSALPEGEEPDPRVLRVRRLQRYALLQAEVLPALSSKDTERRQKLIPKIDALEAVLAKEVPELPPGEVQDEAAELLSQLHEWQLRLVFAQDPAAAIAKAQERVKDQERKGRPSEAERRLFLASQLHATALFDAAAEKGDVAALAEGERTLAAVEQRRIFLRLPADERRRLEPMVERSQMGLLVALLKHERYQRAARLALEFPLLHPASPLKPQAEAVERGALSAIARQRPLTKDQGQRLQVLLQRYVARAKSIPPVERLALAKLFLSAGDLERAASQLEPLKQCPKRHLRVQAHLDLARIARLEARPQMGLDVLDDLGASEQDRLDVILERCLLQRALAEPERALNRYLELLRFLDDPKSQGEWWGIAYETAQTYVEAKQVGEAARFLEGLRQRDRSFGDDPARKRKFRDLMRKVDLLRSR